jgi:dipeptidase E
MTRQLLLLSNSTPHGGGYLDHAWDAIRDMLGETRELVFVPFALHDHEGYTARVRARFESSGIAVRRLPADSTASVILAAAPAVFVGGGNTFRLLDTLQRTGALGVLRRRGTSGLLYVGASAGTNVASPTIRTTNDMPIVQPNTFDALSLVPFQINPHYLDAEPATTYMGETREQRLLEYLEENTRPVIGLREGAWLRVRGDECRLEGTRGARLFRVGLAPEEYEPGSNLSFLLNA